MALSVRHYLFPDEGAPLRLSKRLVDGLVFGEDAMPAYAGTRQRVMSAVVDNEEGKPQEILRIQGFIWHFDASGKIDEGLSKALGETHAGDGDWLPSDTNVVDLSRELSKKRLAEECR